MSIKYLFSRSGRTANIIESIYPGELWPINKDAAEFVWKELRAEENNLICLMGCLVIVPEDIIENNLVVNLHPGLITEYPELKGLNPIKKAFELNLPLGNVLHRAKAEVDSTDIVYSVSKFVSTNEDEADEMSRRLAVVQWCEFLYTYTYYEELIE